MQNIDSDLKELRQNTDQKTLIPSHLQISALNIYIENALLMEKKNNMIDIRGWEDNESENKNVQHDELNDGSPIQHQTQERHLRDDPSTGLDINKLEHHSMFGNESSQMEGNYSNAKSFRNQELLDLAKKGKLFDINLDNIYNSVGKTQVSNFAKLYGVQSHP